MISFYLSARTERKIQVRGMIPDSLSLAIFDMADLAIAHMQDAVGDLGGLGVMRDHQDRLVELAAGASQHVQHGVGVFRVEIAGRLVGQHDGGAADERAGDGDALLFAPGELVGPVSCAGP